ncbi:MAG: nuclear transport factor 2 family protein [Acidobacteriales bacterium]|nr:nuclear transport factor 2 family protein [Terriglobales bacterium]
MRVTQLVALLLFSVFGVAHPGGAPAAEQNSPLYRQITKLDSQLFEAYNHCELEKFGSLVSDDIEFYHDKTGLSVGKDKLLEALRQNICNKVTRELVAGSIEVYPLNGYGAVEIGVHRFRHPLEGNIVAGEAKFIHLWHEENGGWKVTRIISFDHETVKAK